MVDKWGEGDSELMVEAKCIENLMNVTKSYL